MCTRKGGHTEEEQEEEEEEVIFTEYCSCVQLHQ